MTFASKNASGLSGLRLGLFSVALAISPMFAVAQDSVTVDQAALDQVLAQCVSSEACELALQKLISDIVAANPGFTVESIVVAVAAAVSDSYNEGSITAETAELTLTSTAAVGSDIQSSGGGGSSVSAAALSSIVAAAAAAKAGEAIGGDKGNEGSASSN